MRGIFQELKRRNVFRVAVAYVVLGWVLLQATGLIAPGLGLPDWTFPFVFFILIVGFPIALFFAWAFELTPAGLMRTEDVDPTASMTGNTGRRLDFVIIGVLSVALLVLVIDRLFLSPTIDPRNQPGLVRSSIAVLPFVNMSSDPEQEYFSDGISEEILNVLSRTPDLHVTSRSSAFAFKGKEIDIPTVAAHLGVAHILEGSVRKSGKKVRITAQLIETETDRHLWSETYDRELTDILAIQDEIAAAIVRALKSELGYSVGVQTSSVPTNSVEAYDLYLRGLEHLNEGLSVDQYQTAVGYFRNAIDLDPEFASAHARLCQAYMKTYIDSLNPEFLSVAESACRDAETFDDQRAEVKLAVSEIYASRGNYETAISLAEEVISSEPGMYEAYMQLASISFSNRDLEQTTSALKQAIVLRPNKWSLYRELGIALDFQKLQTEALEQYEKALMLSPNNPKVLNNIGVSQAKLGNWESAQQAWQQSLLYGVGEHLTYSNLGAAYYFTRSFDKAAEMYQMAVALAPDRMWYWEGLHASLRFLGDHDEEAQSALMKAVSYAQVKFSTNPNNSYTAAVLGALLTRSGNFEGGREFIERALEINDTDPQTLFFAALEAVEVEQDERALNFLSRAIEHGYPLEVIQTEPVLDDLRETSGYSKLIADQG